MVKGSSLVILLIIPFLFINSASAMLFLWNGTNSTIPENFTCVSCKFTDPFYQEYPRINTTNINSSFYDVGDFPYVHTHTAIINMTRGSLNITATFGDVNGFNRASWNHIHTSATLSPTINSKPLVPFTKGLLVIYAPDNINYLPVGVIGFFNGTVAPDNFSLFADNDGSLIMGNLTKTTFGNFTHSHMNENITTGNPDSLGNGQIGLKANVALMTHKHSLYLQNFTEVNHIPPYVNMPLIIVVNYSRIPLGLIAMFDMANLFANWDNATSGLQNRYLWANSTSFNTTGGEAKHTHPSIYGVTTTSSLNDNLLFCGLFCGNWPGSGHTHIATVGLTNESNDVLPFRNVAIAVYNPTRPNVSIYVLNKTNESFIIIWNTTNNAGVPMFANYTIEWGNTTSFGFKFGNDTFTINATWNNTGLKPNTIYYFNITACNGAGLCTNNSASGKGVYDVTTLANVIPAVPYNWSGVNDFVIRYGQEFRQADESNLYMYAVMILFGLPLLSYMVMRFVPKKKAL